jgi:hypothetical protein
MQCRCSQPLWALGIPDCYPVLRPIRRIAFETVLLSSNAPPHFDLINSTFYPNARRLMTPILYNVESERPEAVFEELSGTKFFVRHQPRTFKALVAKPPTEWGINIEQLRCVSRLGVFLIDEAGMVWGRRVSAEEAAPIPIEPGTIQVRLLFPSDAAITKYEFSFDFAQSLMDFELVPVFADANLRDYVPPIAARIDLIRRWGSQSTGLSIRIYALYARSAGDLYVPITGLAPYIVVTDNANTVIPATFTEYGSGLYDAPNPIPLPPTSGNPYTVRVSGAPTGPFDYTTAIAQFNID